MLPKPPIKIGIIIKNIINTPWKVIHELYCSEEHIINPGKANSNLTINRYNNNKIIIYNEYTTNKINTDPIVVVNEIIMNKK